MIGSEQRSPPFFLKSKESPLLVLNFLSMFVSNQDTGKKQVSTEG